MTPWTSLRYSGDARHPAATRRRYLLDWREGRRALTVRPAVTPDAVDWTGCERPAGRPAEGTPARDVVMPVRMSTEEREAMQRAAEAAGQPVATWLRETGLRAARTQPTAE